MEKIIYDCLLKSCNHLGKAVIFYNKNDEKILFSNEYCQELFQRKGKELNFQEIFPQESRQRLQDFFQRETPVPDCFRRIFDISVITKEDITESSDVEISCLDEMREVLLLNITIKGKEHSLIEENQEDMNQYVEILESISKSLLYRFHIPTRTLYRSKASAEAYHLPLATENFPSEKWLKSVMHPEDIQGFVDFMAKVIEGKAGEHLARTITAEGNAAFEYHKFIFKPLIRADGTIVEMIGSGINVNDLKETEEQLVNINQYFTIIQNATVCVLLRYDIEKRILYRNAQMAKEHGIPAFLENYPNKKEVDRAIHPEDIDDYLAFFDRIIAGEEGVLHARLLTFDDTFEYHAITIKAIKNPDNSIREMLVILKNIQDLKEKENELADVNRQFDALQELSDDLLFRVDIENKILIRRKDMTGIFGIENTNAKFPEEILESGVVHPEDSGIYEDFARQALAGEAGTLELRMKEAESDVFGYRRLTWLPVENSEKKITEVVGKLVNVQTVKDLEEKAKYDGLTKVLNKVAFLESATQILNRAKSTDKHALFFMDLDDFKYVNDNLGHTFGDFLLAELGKRLQDGIRFHDMVGRVGGDEFVIFLRDITTMEVLMGKAKMLLSAISEDFSDGTIRHNIHGSLGIAMYPDHGKTYEELYHHADLALYDSKHKGKNVVTLYTPELEEN